MASNMLLTTTILILSFLAYSMFTVEAYNSIPCKPPTPMKPKLCSPPPMKPKSCPLTLTVEHCSNNTLKLRVCANLLGVVDIIVSTLAPSKCYALLEGLADLKAALYLCTTIKANVLGINLNVPFTLSLLLNVCQKIVLLGFQYA